MKNPDHHQAAYFHQIEFQAKNITDSEVNVSTSSVQSDLESMPKQRKFGFLQVLIYNLPRKTEVNRIYLKQIRKDERLPRPP